jgi:hypothetical protein
VCRHRDVDDAAAWWSGFVPNVAAILEAVRVLKPPCETRTDGDAGQRLVKGSEDRLWRAPGDPIVAVLVGGLVAYKASEAAALLHRLGATRSLPCAYRKPQTGFRAESDGAVPTTRHLRT